MTDRTETIIGKGFVAIHDIMWQNMKCTIRKKVIKRISSYLILVLLFFILATPAVNLI